MNHECLFKSVSIWCDWNKYFNAQKPYIFYVIANSLLTFASDKVGYKKGIKRSRKGQTFALTFEIFNFHHNIMLTFVLTLTFGALGVLGCENGTLPDGSYCPNAGLHVITKFFAIFQSHWDIYMYLIAVVWRSTTLLNVLGMLQWLSKPHDLPRQSALWFRTWLVLASWKHLLWKQRLWWKSLQPRLRF